jgi:nitrate/nitrite transporter NarK
LFRPFAGFMSDLFQRKGWTPLPFIAKELPYAPRLHWLGIALILITVSMAGLTIAGLYGSLPLSVVTLMALGIFISFGTGGTFALVPLLFPDRPGIAAGFVGGISTFGGIVYPLIFAAAPRRTSVICTSRSTCSCRSSCSTSGPLATSGARRSTASSAAVWLGSRPESRDETWQVNLCQ